MARPWQAKQTPVIFHTNNAFVERQKKIFSGRELL
jgi:hypothetical protein